MFDSKLRCPKTPKDDSQKKGQGDSSGIAENIEDTANIEESGWVGGVFSKAQKWTLSGVFGHPNSKPSNRKIYFYYTSCFLSRESLAPVNPSQVVLGTLHLRSQARCRQSLVPALQLDLNSLCRCLSLMRENILVLFSKGNSQFNQKFVCYFFFS